MKSIKRIICIVVPILIVVFIVSWIKVGFQKIENAWQFPYTTQTQQMAVIFEENREAFEKIRTVALNKNINTGFTVHPNDTNTYWANYRETVEENVPSEIVEEIVYLIEKYYINDFLFTDSYIRFHQLKPALPGENGIDFSIWYDKASDQWGINSQLVISSDKNRLIYRLYHTVYGRQKDYI